MIDPDEHKGKADELREWASRAAKQKGRKAASVIEDLTLGARCDS